MNSTQYNSETIVDYKKNKYVAIEIYYNHESSCILVPSVIDYDDYDNFKKYKWHFVGSGYIGHTTKQNKILYFHNLVMGNLSFNGKGLTHNIVDHVNRIGTDNRKANLRFVNQSAQNYNQCKRVRKLKSFPDSVDIDIDKIPSLIQYMSPQRVTEKNKHRSSKKKIGDIIKADTFEIDIKHYTDKNLNIIDERIRRKFTESKDVSIEDKLLLAKIYLSSMIDHNKDFFKDKCMNGDLSYQSQILYDEYYDILDLAGIKPYIPKKDTKNNTNRLLYVSDVDKIRLKKYILIYPDNLPIIVKPKKKSVFS